MPTTPLRKVLASQNNGGRALFEKDLLDDIPFSPGGLSELGLDFTPPVKSSHLNSHNTTTHPSSTGRAGASPFTDFVNTSLTPLNTMAHGTKRANNGGVGSLMSPSSILRKPLISSPPLSRNGWVRVEIGVGMEGLKEINRMTWRSPEIAGADENSAASGYLNLNTRSPHQPSSYHHPNAAVGPPSQHHHQNPGPYGSLPMQGSHNAPSGPPVLHSGTGMGRSQKKKIVCNCKKSKCLKLYCECFAALQECDSCNCNECRNVVEFREIREEAIRATKAKNPNAFRQKIANQTNHSTGCRCKKSFCLKKYCECYEANVFCGDKCRCANCANYVGSIKLVERRKKIKDHKGAAAAVKAAEIHHEQQIHGGNPLAWGDEQKLEQMPMHMVHESPTAEDMLNAAQLAGGVMSPRDFGKDLNAEFGPKEEYNNGRVSKVSEVQGRSPVRSEVTITRSEATSYNNRKLTS
ncbi:hypothetical protein TL16_g10609 [Triparma laevis f. inornata]|uniref:CRC domain-containing protein n=1 Tax=Triparma laevis f. inornata TaxID=1714386 RepID=A0A9W7BFC4_9STRA|nr:hypothetical protein TL16_g10609 [Triparma laevis f. inornata]